MPSTTASLRLVARRQHATENIVHQPAAEVDEYGVSLAVDLIPEIVANRSFTWRCIDNQCVCVLFETQNFLHLSCERLVMHQQQSEGFRLFQIILVDANDVLFLENAGINQHVFEALKLFLSEYCNSSLRQPNSKSVQHWQNTPSPQIGGINDAAHQY